MTYSDLMHYLAVGVLAAIALAVLTVYVADAVRGRPLDPFTLGIFTTLLGIVSTVVGVRLGSSTTDTGVRAGSDLTRTNGGPHA